VTFGPGESPIWVHAIGVGSAAAAMAASVPRRNTPLLGLGTLAMLGYVTSLVVRYFHESVGSLERWESPADED
jgi:hypothetical protein